MGKKEKTIELKAKVDKISDEHLDELRNLVNSINSLQFNIGRIEADKHAAIHELATHQQQVTVMQDKLTKEYGSYDVNLKDGTINWPKDEK